MSPIDQLTNDALAFISECTGEVPKEILVTRMNKYFTDRQKLEMAADQVISHQDFATKEAAPDSRPAGF